MTLTFRRTRTAALAVSVLLVPGLVTVSAPASAALPTVPDTLFPGVTEDPSVTVTLEDGTLVTDSTVVHRGDVLLVHGEGFSPDANRGGFVMPVFPGVPNGVYVLYSGFGADWRPSDGAPGEARTHPHDQLAWVLPDASLNALPTVPDMRTPIAREAQRMDTDGTFTARIVVDPPAQTPGDRFGVYVYPAAGSVNAAEEIFVPLRFSPAPGDSAPAVASPDLILDAGLPASVADAAGGGLTPRDGASLVDGDRIAFSLDAAGAGAGDGAGAGVVGGAGDSVVGGAGDSVVGGDGVVKYRGTVHARARFSMADVVVKDPWVVTKADGTRVLTAEISDGYNSSDDAVTRRELGTLVGRDGGLVLVRGPVNLGAVTIAG